MFAQLTSDCLPVPAEIKGLRRHRAYARKPAAGYKALHDRSAPVPTARQCTTSRNRAAHSPFRTPEVFWISCAPELTVQRPKRSPAPATPHGRKVSPDAANCHGFKRSRLAQALATANSEPPRCCLPKRENFCSQPAPYSSCRSSIQSESVIWRRISMKKAPRQHIPSLWFQLKTHDLRAEYFSSRKPFWATRPSREGGSEFRIPRLNDSVFRIPNSLHFEFLICNF